MSLYKLIVAYDGTRFHGFQRQIDNATLTSKSSSSSTTHHDHAVAGSKRRPQKRPLFQNDGTRRHCNVSVQEVLELAILDLCQQASVRNKNGTTSTIGCTPSSTTTAATIIEVNLKAASRTDKGVHARGQVVTVRLPTSSSDNCDTAAEDDNLCWKLRQSINSRLPVDISVVSVAKLLDDKELDPRHDVVEKHYSYTIKYQRMPLQQQERWKEKMGGPVNSIRHALDDPPCMWVCPWPLDDSLLPKLVEQLRGTHDYTAFVHKNVRHAKNNTLTVAMDFTVTETRTEYFRPVTCRSTAGSTTCGDDNEGIRVDFVTARFDFRSKGFRRTMLRNLVGYCVDVCRGLETAPTVDRLFDNNNNNNDSNSSPVAVCAAPASGLCLESVSY